MKNEVEKLKNIGGNEWQKGDHHRVYFNNLEKWFDQASNDSWTLNNKKVTRKQYAQKVTAKFFYNAITGEWNWNADELTEKEVDILIKNIKNAITPVETKIEEEIKIEIEKTTLIAKSQAGVKIICEVGIDAKGDFISQYPIRWAKNKKMNLAGYAIVLSKKQAEKIFKRKCPVAEVDVLLENQQMFKKLKKAYQIKKNKAIWEKMLDKNKTLTLTKKFYTSGKIGIVGLPEYLNDKKDFLKHAIEFDNNDERYTAKISATEINDILAKSAKNKREKENVKQAKIADLGKKAKETGESQILSTHAIPAGNDLLESDTLITYVNPDGTVTEKTYRDW